MNKYQPTIGLEIHAELKTKTKMFCDSLNDPNEKHPNTNVCPVCLGHPGTLPTINKDAVAEVIKVGLALGGKINPITKFDRKNYFYPDLPKGYQISQYDQPLVLGGELNGVRIRRVHLEEDTGTLIHDNKSSSSLVDFNRAGVPLMELVTEPDLKSAEEVSFFAKELQSILRYLGVSDADMEKGQMRIEANVSIQDPRWKFQEGYGLKSGLWVFSGDKTVDPSEPPLNPRVELKNINSFRFAKDAIDYELKRQEEVLERGEKIKQETRGWDSKNNKTVSQRSKEEAHDYRYFPEPDLPPFETSIFDIEKVRAELPELPSGKRIRLINEFALSEKQAEMFVADKELSNFFEEAASELKSQLPSVANYQSLFNILTSDLRGSMNEAGINFADLKFNPEHFAHLVVLVEEKKVTSHKAKDLLAQMFKDGRDPEEIMQSEGFAMISDEAELESVVRGVIEENPSAVADYKKGKMQAVQFLIGKTMAKLKGRGNPAVLEGLIKKLL